VIGLCGWHHRAEPWAGQPIAWCRQSLGPSLAEGSKPFHEFFGSDEELLAIQARLLEKYHDSETD
jgi:hypothetical protein